MVSRSHIWRQASEPNTVWDLIVVGGGITGAGVAMVAAGRGLNVLLLEQQDYAWGTSSRSSKMVHGGLRYLAQGDLHLTRDSLQEREWLIKALPGLVERMGYYYVLGPKAPLRFGVKMLLWTYDWLAGVKNHFYVSPTALRTALPEFDTSHCNGAYYYTDAVTDDSRLVLRLLQEAKSRGAVCLNYSKVTGFCFEGTTLSGVDVLDQLTGATAKIRSHVVVNATGAWADRLRNRLNPEKRVRPQRGSHILISQDRLRVDGAMTLMHPSDGRYHFIYPWAGRTVIGTTDLDHTLDLDIEARISAPEIQYLLDAANTVFPSLVLTPADIISTWAGVRPIIASEKSKDPSKERRDHAVWTDNKLVTVSGGKLTTFRLIAEDVLAAAASLLPDGKADLCAPLTKTNTMVFETGAAVDLAAAPIHLAAEYQARFGAKANSLMQACVDEKRQMEFSSIADTDCSLAECRWALRHEQVVHLDDLMLRRTHLGLLLKQGGTEILDDLQAICCDELGWSETQWLAERKRYLNLIHAFYSTASLNDKSHHIAPDV